MSHVLFSVLTNVINYSLLSDSFHHLLILHASVLVKYSAEEQSEVKKKIMQTSS